MQWWEGDETREIDMDDFVFHLGWLRKETIINEEKRIFVQTEMGENMCEFIEFGLDLSH